MSEKEGRDAASQPAGLSPLGESHLKARFIN